MTLDEDAETPTGTRVLTRAPVDAGARRQRKGTNVLAGVLAAGSVLPAVVAAAWVLAAMPLLVLHIYRPLPATVLAVVVAVALGRPALRVASEAARRFGAVPWWVLAGVLAVVVGFGVLAFVTSAGDVLVRRDPGSYAMSAAWLTTHGTIQMPTHAAAFGGTDPNLVLASQGFYVQGSHIIPQFMTGVPVLMAVGGWIGGLAGVLHTNAFLGMFALLAFAGLVTRLVGARWAPLAVLALALAQPELDVMRATYSEPAAQLILLGGLAIVLDALQVGRLGPITSPKPEHRGSDARMGGTVAAVRDCRRGLLVGGLVLGLVSLVRVDAIADLLPLVLFLGWLAFHRQFVWKWLAAGTVAGLAVGAFDCLFLTLPYAKHLGSDLATVIGGLAVLIPLTVVAVKRARSWRRHHPERARSTRWAGVAAVVVLLTGAFFFLRPHLMTMRSSPRSGGANYVGQVQRYLGMPIDSTRSYYENALRWLSWYVGWATLALALIGAAWLAYGLVKGRHREWLPALLVFVGMTAAVLLKPSITPDHPWADRRFVPVALPGVVLLAFAAVALVVRRIGTRRYAVGVVPAIRAVAIVAAVALIVAPIWAGSRHVFTTQTEKGEVAMVDRVCTQLWPGDAVLAFGSAAITAWPGTVRVMCGVGVGYLDGRDNAAALARVAQHVQANGGRLMILVDGAGDKARVPGAVEWPATPTATLHTTEVGHTLVTRPDSAAPLPFEMWLGQLTSATH